MKIFNNCDFLPWYICCFFVKYSGRPVISILKTSAQKKERNNAAALNLMKSDSFREDVFFGSVFWCWLAFFSELFLASDKLCINKFFLRFLTYFWYSIDKHGIDWPFDRLNFLVALFLSLVIMNSRELSTWNLDNKISSFKFLIELMACDG